VLTTWAHTRFGYPDKKSVMATLLLHTKQPIVLKNLAIKSGLTYVLADLKKQELHGTLASLETKKHVILYAKKMEKNVHGRINGLQLRMN